MEGDEAQTDDYPHYYGSIGEYMDQISEKTADLIVAIRQSNEYKRYQEARQKLHEDPDLERAVHEFRKRNYQIQNSGNIDLFNEVDHLDWENSQMIKNPVVEEYMAAEIAYCRVVQEINWRLIEGMDFEVGFVNE